MLCGTATCKKKVVRKDGLNMMSGTTICNSDVWNNNFKNVVQDDVHFTEIFVKNQMQNLQCLLG